MFGFVQQKWGIFFTRMICGCFTSVGLIFFIFYETNAYYLYPAMIFGN